MMPDELPGGSYFGKTYEELVSLLLQRDGEIDAWRERWKDEQQQRIALQERDPWTQKLKSA